MLSCVCSVIDHRWRQNVVRTKKWHTRRSRVCHWCSYHILTSSVIYYWIRRTATWNLFVLYNNEKPFFILKYFNITRKPAFCPAFARKKASWRDLLSIQNEAVSLVAMRSKESWWVEKNRATVKPDSSVAPRWMKTYSESRIELRNLQILKKKKLRANARPRTSYLEDYCRVNELLRYQWRITDFELTRGPGLPASPTFATGYPRMATVMQNQSVHHFIINL